MIVQVYKNVRKNCYSIREKKTRKVVHHATHVFLNDVKFYVSKKGRERVLREKRKNVHAWVEGKLHKERSNRLKEGMKLYTTDGMSFDQNGSRQSLTEVDLAPLRVSYNPYKTESFVNINGNIVEKTPFALLTPQGVFAYG